MFTPGGPPTLSHCIGSVNFVQLPLTETFSCFQIGAPLQACVSSASLSCIA